MTRTRQNHKALRFAVSSAIAAALVSGCAGSSHLARAGNYASQANGSHSAKGIDRAVAKAEEAVGRTPFDAGARVQLADTYLRAGRFESAAATYNDAIALGDTSARTALSLALANIGIGRNREAVAILDQSRNSLPASDLGLALALAGETGRGVAILGEALRDGDNSPKLRQNLAYAYALDGRWREARLMAAQDVPADQLDARISNWARQGKPEDYQQRVAGLLGAPVRVDSGQPMELALRTSSAVGAPEMAAVEPDFRLQAADDSGELPPVAPAQQNESLAAAPASSAPIQSAMAKPAAIAAPSVTSVSFEGKLATTTTFVSNPVIQPIPERSVIRDRRANQAAATRGTVRASTEGTHLVQLGSFSSAEGARRAWNVYASRNPELRLAKMTITEAVVGGKHFWRVAAGGFDKRSASGVCSVVRSRGGGCIAYGASSPLPGAVPSHGGKAMMARR